MSGIWDTLSSVFLSRKNNRYLQHKLSTNYFSPSISIPLTDFLVLYDPRLTTRAAPVSHAMRSPFSALTKRFAMDV